MTRSTTSEDVEKDETSGSRVGSVAGRRAVLAIVSISVLATGGLGYVFGLVGARPSAVGRLGPVAVPLSPVGLAVYGVVATSVPLALLLVLVRLALDRADADDPVPE